jgi:hypothetical protein
MHIIIKFNDTMERKSDNHVYVYIKEWVKIAHYLEII